ncbi:MAG TPA: hypothetical protein PKA28_03085 [Methylomusa anaerophila]|uniref:Uncharacterized protein n=1 Tax=Methylomusa anaerophila TaxID=1930071 RepID=A0A348ANT9_9FIRM|nr:hypothetical protein [Methylomusa anaerophila]BBB92737.1 hypothetical protein MAMMFC1_03433 [Methylomusa anaerophila]HML87410.1 hypothetical protein [Methylomusa anaerophila]
MTEEAKANEEKTVVEEVIVAEETTSRDAICKLTRILRRLQGEEDVNIRTVGGFEFEGGRLVRVEDGLVVLTDVEVDLPGGDEIDLGNVTINLCAITSVGIDDRHC